ncbi:chromatin assembly factor 1 subunit A-like [Cydia fagiglandana]|uniref:chromatin assembly factor 1 subunit A-like n=1 Tax=Cydia fagiglandana TaxID=1458189 RepID=UPI002FEE1B71
MKTNKAVENVEITPSKKKLTQARLPFKLISEDASTPVAPPTRKRKLSVDGTEPAPKGKICKENNEIDEMVVISDDECKDKQKMEKEAKVMNPFVKLVDTAWKKKLQKAKSPKKRKSRKSTSKLIESTENKSETEQGDAEDVEMDVDIEEQSGNKQKSPKASPKSKKTVNKASNDGPNDVVELEDSNDCSDVRKPNETEKESDTNTEVKETSPVTPRSSRKSKSNTDTERSNESEAPKTPVRKAKDSQDKANTSLPAKLNESVSSPSTPKRNSRSSSVTNSLNDSVSESTSTPAANLTPKQKQKKLESAKKREEREKEKQEREKKRQEEKEEKARQRQEKEDAKKREREEKEEQKRKEKEEKEKQKELEKKLREEKEEQKKKEREEKEEQRRKEKEEKEEQKRKEKEAREEEKRKKQEALELEKQEQELKKKKAAEAFVNFFVPKQKEKEPKAVVSQNSILSSFTIKADMRLAPLIRVELSDMQKKDMDELMSDQKSGEKDLYLKNLKKEGVKTGCSGKTWPLTDKEDDDVMIVEDELPPIEGADEILACEEATREKLRPKLFSFHENKRPPYWGTWRKKSAFVTARRPFGQEKQLDYDVDSDEDWEEEQEGESLDGSVAGDDEEPDDDYEVDNEVFVPHGYLSDEEATMDEEEDKDNVLSLSPETQKARLKNLEDEFENEMKKPTEKLKPRLYGLIWEAKDGGKPEKCIDALWNYFGKLSMIMDDAAIDSLLQPPSEPQEPEKKKVKKKKLAEGEQQSPKSDKKKKAKPESKETKKAKAEPKQENKKNQPGINSFLTKLKST